MAKPGSRNILKALTARVTATLMYPALYSYLTLQSEATRLRSFGKPPTVHHEAPYAGQKVLLLALYQKGVLRPDTLRLLRAAKAAGLYVLAVNTLKLKDPGATEDLIDCYIERFNFGRDFGSYQRGFLHLFARGWHESCPRLLMLNDSVYFTEERMPAFLDEMLDSETEVLGATENYEIEYHLGSFCIALAGDILRARPFRRYWRRYRLSDVRPRVIFGGEMGLSRTLRRCASSQGEMRAHYGAHAFLKRLEGNPEMMDFAIRAARVSPLTGWKRLSRRDIVDNFRDNFLISTFDPEEFDYNYNIEAAVTGLNEKVYIDCFADLKAAVDRSLAEGSEIRETALRRVVEAELTEVFMQGSQIHQNATTLLHMGLPIVKLDGLYRGMFMMQDVQTICDQLTAGEKRELQEQLLDRPYGGDVLFGWKRAAFIRGLI